MQQRRDGRARMENRKRLMDFQQRKMGILAWAASGAATICLTAASTFAQSGSDNQWVPAPSSYSQGGGGTRDDGWNARQDASDGSARDSAARDSAARDGAAA